MDEETIGEKLGGSTISRRNLIKAGAIVGGTVWVAPVIDSFVSPASANTQSASGVSTCCSCSSPTPGNLSSYCDPPGLNTSVSACKAFCASQGFGGYTFCQAAPGGGYFNCDGSPAVCTPAGGATSSDCTSGST